MGSNRETDIHAKIVPADPSSPEVFLITTEIRKERFPNLHAISKMLSDYELIKIGLGVGVVLLGTEAVTEFTKVSFPTISSTFFPDSEPLASLDMYPILDFVSIFAESPVGACISAGVGAVCLTVLYFRDRHRMREIEKELLSQRPASKYPDDYT